jgi:hypothetical protein
MKKVLFVTIAMAVAMTGFAQKAVVKDGVKNQNVTVQKPSALRISDGSAVQGVQFTMPEHMTQTSRDYETLESMITNYDLQSNSALGNRIAVWPNGDASFAATWDYSGNTSFPDRGTGYNFYNAELAAIGDQPEVRQESVKSGWPSITPCGEGELLASHATGVNLYYRPTRGEGEWQLIYNWGNDYGAPTWPRVVVSGPNNKYVHLVMCKQEGNSTIGYTNHIYYVRLTHDGDNWNVPEELNEFPNLDNTADGDYRNQLSADDYVMAANGNTVAVLFNSYTTEVFYMISHDNGETWERQIIAPFPILNENGEPVHAIDFADYPNGMTDTIHTGDNSGSIAIDNNGVVHVAFALFHWQVADADSYTYWPAYGYGICYWNSNYTNEHGGHEIPLYGTSAVDAGHSEWTNNGVGYTIIPDRIEELAELNGQEHNLHVFGWIDDNNNGTYGEYDNVTGASWHYRSLGLVTMPSVSVDNEGNIAIINSVLSEARICDETGFSYRSAFVTLRDNGGTWFDQVVDLNGDFMLGYTESYPTVASPVAYDGTFWMYFSGDDKQGLYLDISDTYPQSNGGILTDNYIYAIRLTPDKDTPGLETWGVQHNEAVNPMTTVRVYPNPATDVLNVEVNASQTSAVNISVFNIMGQKVTEQNITVNAGLDSPTINTADFASGIYCVTFKANCFENTMNFIVK